MFFALYLSLRPVTVGSGREERTEGQLERTGGQLERTCESIIKLKKIVYILPDAKNIVLLHLIKTKEDWQSDRMRWTRNPVYPFSGIGGLNPSSSAIFAY